MGSERSRKAWVPFLFAISAAIRSSISSAASAALKFDIEAHVLKRTFTLKVLVYSKVSQPFPDNLCQEIIVVIL